MRAGVKSVWLILCDVGHVLVECTHTLPLLWAQRVVGRAGATIDGMLGNVYVAATIERLHPGPYNCWGLGFCEPGRILLPSRAGAVSHAIGY